MDLSEKEDNYLSEKSKRNLWVDYLRSGITVLVIAHHAALAYTTFASFDKSAYIKSTNPIVDSKRWMGLDLFVNFNDIFFMSLMFFIGGLFLSKSIEKKGLAKFSVDRTFRLFFPFLILGTLFMLIAYIPAYYVAYGNFDLWEYIKDFFTVQQWPVGPPWFIWVLFVFNLLFAGLYPMLKKQSTLIQRAIGGLKDKAIPFIGLLLVITWILYVPLAYQVGAGTWTGFGPFDLQLSRILLYFGYFLLGSLIGLTNFSESIFTLDSGLVRNWRLLAISCCVFFVMLTLGSKFLERMVIGDMLKEFNAWMVYYTLYISSCVFSTLAFIAVFRKFVKTSNSWWNSLSENAYLIYLIHYIFIVWVQFLLMDFNVSAFLKFMITFVLSFSLSWLTSILLRKINLVRQYL